MASQIGWLEAIRQWDKGEIGLIWGERRVGPPGHRAVSGVGSGRLESVNPRDLDRP